MWWSKCDAKTAMKSKLDVEKGELDVGICTQLSDGGQVISHDPVVWVANPGFVMQNHQTVSIAVFEEGCIFRTWALEALEKSGISYRIVYVSRSISGLIDAVRAGFAVAPIIRSNVPPDLKIVGLENGLPVLPVSNIVLHKTKKVDIRNYRMFFRAHYPSLRRKNINGVQPSGVALPKLALVIPTGRNYAIMDSSFP